MDATSSVNRASNILVGSGMSKLSGRSRYG